MRQKYSTSWSTKRSFGQRKYGPQVPFKAILNRAAEPGLGFEDKFPAEERLSSTWIKEGMYDFATGTLSAPDKGSSYVKAWTIGTDFLEQAKSGKVSLSGLFDQLRDAPFGMKHGFLSYWVPMFLMTVEDEFSLFYLPENKYLPYLSVDIFESIQRHPNQFAIKALNIQGVSQATLNQYRELAQVDPNAPRRSPPTSASSTSSRCIAP